MSENSETVKKLNESFGQFDSSNNVNTETSISDNSEDDKKQPKDVDLHLSYEQPSTNDAMQQKVDDVVTPAQAKYSQDLIDEDKLEQAKKDLDKMEEAAHSYVEEVQEEYEKAGGIQGIAKEKVNEIKEGLENDPVNTLTDLGKKALMVIGGFALLKAIFRK